MTNEERKQLVKMGECFIKIREALKERYDLTDWEADVMAAALEKQASQYVEKMKMAG